MVSRLRRVDRSRFKKLAFPHLEFLYNVALKYCGTSYDAEDIVQETMYSAYRNFHQLRDENKCRQWLFAILRTTFLKERRSFIRRPLLDDGSGYLKHLADESVESLAVHLEKKIAHQQLQDVLDRMAEKQKMPLILYYMEDMTYQEIADYLEVPIGTVMSRLSRAKNQLKKSLLQNVARKKKASARVSLISLFCKGVI